MSHLNQVEPLESEEDTFTVPLRGLTRWVVSEMQFMGRFLVYKRY
jgi:hypothetical protein